MKVLSDFFVLEAVINTLTFNMAFGLSTWVQQRNREDFGLQQVSICNLQEARAHQFVASFHRPQVVLGTSQWHSACISHMQTHTPGISQLNAAHTLSIFSGSHRPPAPSHLPFLSQHPLPSFYLTHFSFPSFFPFLTYVSTSMKVQLITGPNFIIMVILTN